MKSQRRNQLLSQLRNKVVARGGKPNLRVRLQRTFGKFDRDASGELDMEEFRMAVEEQLPGLTDDEVNSLALSFDENKDGVVSIDEFVQTLLSCDDTTWSQPMDKAQTRRPPPGVALRRAAEFYDDGYNIKGESDLTEALVSIRQAAASLGPAEALLRRALERQRSTSSAKHLTLSQFRTALASFTKEDVDLLWKKCASNYETFLSLVLSAKVAVPAPRQEPTRLQSLLLDKILSKGGDGGMRLRIKRVLDKYDVDKSGHLERDECARIMTELLHGITPADIDDLTTTLVAASSSIDAVVTTLLATHRSRDQTDVSLPLAKKAPVYTKAGARGLS